MKKLVAVVILGTAAITAQAETVYTPVGTPVSCTGQHFNISSANEVLYKSRACKLPLVNSKNMRQYTFAAQGMAWDGCWENLLGDRVALISSDGSEEVRDKIGFVVSELARTGDAVVTKSPMQDIYKKQGRELCN
ncbi:hypothetical protein LGM43_26600 [Burkholderia seminalis]|uniref:hypothetical protein n=1 Tax=Burkholderia seminalis TaxID=488731 RepID=UPI001CF250A2|nr:hypothetical protein [Burkholderia seminalis]MCA7953843.1 hypothetical protein [Burkholderia seminalis]